ncbi:MAG TPA: carboxypeptidase-like regulatory domain-containing protein [Pyrinomonadaceae bacterium]|nr:carboxypeptidase-like regulatory domain-containing protein [Pyrinomonadaceae bacterium]
MFKNTSFLAAVVILLGSICFSTHAQEPPRVAESEPSNGVITGRVVNERGEPMAGATVYVRPIGAMASSRNTTTDTEGNFRVTSLEPALYLVTSYSPAYVLLPQEPDASPNYYRIGDSVRLELIRGGVLTGTVTNAAGEPIVGIRVRALRIGEGADRTPRLFSGGPGDRPTDDRGIYRIYGLPPGTYVVSAGGPGSPQTMQMNPFETDVPTYSPSATRDNAAEYSVRSGEETIADIRYRSDPGRTVSGVVRVAGQNGAGVTLFGTDGSYIPAASTFQMPGARGFALTGVGDGEYNVYAQEMISPPGPGSATPDFSISEVKRVSVKGADITGIELTPRPLSVLSGVVELEPSKAPECQGKRKPEFAEMLIEIQRNQKDPDPPIVMMRLTSNPLSVDSKGGFKIRNLMPGRYRFNPRFFARYWYLQSITTGSAPATTTAKTATAAKTDAAANWTTIRSGEQLSNITITIAQGAASIRGNITVAEGVANPVMPLVYLVPAEREKADDVLRYFVADVSHEGIFGFNSLPPGRYWALVQTAPAPEIATLVKLRLPESAEARLKLRRAAEAQKSSVELKPCQALVDYLLPVK